VRHPLDFVQDIHSFQAGTAVLALWSGQVFLVRLHQARLKLPFVRLRAPERCVPPLRPLLYSAVLVRETEVYATLSCGPSMLHRTVPEPLARPMRRIALPAHSVQMRGGVEQAGHRPHAETQREFAIVPVP